MDARMQEVESAGGWYSFAGNLYYRYPRPVYVYGIPKDRYGPMQHISTFDRDTRQGRMRRQAHRLVQIAKDRVILPF